jgi:uroporphyrinogen-III synthase
MILSTKKLSTLQKEVFENSGLEIIDYDAIKIELIDFKAPKKIENAIFSSKNAVTSFFSPHNIASSVFENAYCIGGKTKSLLAENGQKVIKMHQNASKLAHFLTNKVEKGPFYFFCGNLRRHEIPEALNEAKIGLFEVKTYQTELNPVFFEQNWDKILFFSPSGVRSFMEQNKIKNSTAICIGNTTASEAKKYTNNIIIADSATAEGVIEKAVNMTQTS